MKICDEINKTRFHMTMLFSRMITAICKVLQIINSAKINFSASKKKLYFQTVILELTLLFASTEAASSLIFLTSYFRDSSFPFCRRQLCSLLFCVVFFLLWLLISLPFLSFLLIDFLSVIENALQ